MVWCQCLIVVVQYGRIGMAGFPEQRSAGITEAWETPGALIEQGDARGKKTRSAPFLCISDHFAKTGSGQTQGKHSKRDAFFL